MKSTMGGLSCLNVADHRIIKLQADLSLKVI